MQTWVVMGDRECKIVTASEKNYIGAKKMLDNCFGSSIGLPIREIIGVYCS
jgi:hypothetical protein